MVLNLLIELCAFLLKLESRFLELLVSGLQLLHLQAWWGPYIPLDFVVEVVRWGSLFLMDAFDVSLGGTRHETLMRGVMAPPVGVRAGGRLRFSRDEVMERLCDIFGHPYELIVCGEWRCALRHRVAIGLCGVEKTEQERCWGAPNEVFRR